MLDMSPTMLVHVTLGGVAIVSGFSALLLPQSAVLILMVFWLIRILYFKKVS